MCDYFIEIYTENNVDFFLVLQLNIQNTFYVDNFEKIKFYSRCFLSKIEFFLSNSPVALKYSFWSIQWDTGFNQLLDTRVSV